MNDRKMESLIAKSFEQLPEKILIDIKREIAMDIALQLLEKLEGQMNPKKRESIDRINEETDLFLEETSLLERGA